MSVTTSQEKLAGAGARFGNYRGSQAVSSFGDTAAEFGALLGKVGMIDASWQAKLVLSGEDRVRWLNGMVTNNIRDLAHNQGVYNFLLNAQGRIQGDLVAYNRGDYLLVATDRAQAPAISEIFERYIIMDDVEVGDISDKLATVAILGPTAAELLKSLEIDVSQLNPGELMDLVWRDLGITVGRNVQPHFDGYELWFAPNNFDKVWDILQFAGAAPLGSEALELYRIARGVPLYGADLRDRDLPQETGQKHALSFSKGCYIGQEIVERIHARAILHRTFAGFEVSGNPVAAGTKIRAGDKDVGEVTSSARIPFPAGGRTVALGYVRREAAAPGTPVQIGEQSATVREVPFEY